MGGRGGRVCEVGGRRVSGEWEKSVASDENIITSTVGRWCLGGGKISVNEGLIEVVVVVVTGCLMRREVGLLG